MKSRNAAVWAGSAANKFRAVTRTTDDPTTKTLAEGLVHLAEAVRDLDARLEEIEKAGR